MGVKPIICPLCAAELSGNKQAAEHFAAAHNANHNQDRAGADIKLYTVNLVRSSLARDRDVRWTISGVTCFCGTFLGSFTSRAEAIAHLAKHIGKSGGLDKHFTKTLFRLAKGEL